MTRIPIRRALISVYDKTGLADLASGLHAAGVEIVSTGSTAARIAAAGVPVTRVEELTGFPECFDGRVKTLHPRVHAGLLADTANPAHEAQLAELGIEPFQLLVSNLYPFEAAVASGASPEQCVEQIDIGGPAMVRAAAKNHGSVAVVIEPSRYADALAALAEGGFTRDQRRQLAAAAFAHTAAYDLAVASWFASGYAPDEIAEDSGWPAVAGALWRRAEVLRYGENPHQRAALYKEAQDKDLSTERGGAGRPGAGTGIAAAELLHGKAMSYNNYVDADAARRAAYDFADPCVAIIKHSNPCGIAVGADLAQAHAKAHACDPASAFGGVIAANGPVTAELARQIAEVFTEVVIAPDFDAEALDILSVAKNIRLLRLPGGTTPRNPPLQGGFHPPRTPHGGNHPPRPPRGDPACPRSLRSCWPLRPLRGPRSLRSCWPLRPLRGPRSLRSCWPLRPLRGPRSLRSCWPLRPLRGPRSLRSCWPLRPLRGPRSLRSCWPLRPLRGPRSLRSSWPLRHPRLRFPRPLRGAARGYGVAAGERRDLAAVGGPRP